jgi:hypothetical protein
VAFVNGNHPWQKYDTARLILPRFTIGGTHANLSQLSVLEDQTIDALESLANHARRFAFLVEQRLSIWVGFERGHLVMFADENDLTGRLTLALIALAESGRVVRRCDACRNFYLTESPARCCRSCISSGRAQSMKRAAGRLRKAKSRAGKVEEHVRLREQEIQELRHDLEQLDHAEPGANPDLIKARQRQLERRLSSLQAVSPRLETIRENRKAQPGVRIFVGMPGAPIGPRPIIPSAGPDPIDGVPSPPRRSRPARPR